VIDFLGIATLTAVLLLGAVLTLYNSRQAAALQELERVIGEFYLMQAADRREQRRKEVQIGDPLAWVSKQTGVTVTGVERTLADPPAVELLTENPAYRLVISPLAPRELRTALKPLEVKNGRTSKLVDPLLGRKAEAVDRSIANSGEWFDIEAEQAGKAFGVEWGEPKRLWFYAVKK